MRGSHRPSANWQELRKSAGFEIADRIRLSYEGDAEVARVLQAWRDYISQETLAEAISPGVDGGPSTLRQAQDAAGSGRNYVEEQEIEGRKVRLAVAKL